MRQRVLEVQAWDRDMGCRRLITLEAVRTVDVRAGAGMIAMMATELMYYAHQRGIEPKAPTWTGRIVWLDDVPHLSRRR